MRKITSFTVNHTKLKPGVYLSRQDNDILTYDIRVTRPNLEPAMTGPAAHTIEHIGATILRNGPVQDKIIYFGPMGCLTGFYLLVRDLDIERVTGLTRAVFEEISEWNQPIPGAKKEECGNYTFMDLAAAQKTAVKFLNQSWDHKYQLLDEEEKDDQSNI